MFELSFLYCVACRAVRRLHFAPVSSGLPTLGDKIACAYCAHVGLVLVQRRGAFCPVCDSICPARLEPSSLPSASSINCGTCRRRLVTLYAEPAVKSVELGGGLRRKA